MLLLNFKNVSVYVLNLKTFKPILFFLLKYWVGQISSTTNEVIKWEKKLYKKKTTIKSSKEKNLK